MKKISLIIISVFICRMAMSQTPKQKTDSIKYRHEFGLDITNFIKTSQTQLYLPIYYLTYRYHFKKSNIRAAIGGAYKKTNAKSSTSNPVRLTSIEKSIDFRVGYELVYKISKRFNMFYGLDFRPSITNNRKYNPYASSGYFQGTQTNTKIIGFAPLLGIKFKINDRISLTSEASFTLNYSEEFSKRIYKPISDQYPTKEDDFKNDYYYWYSNFNQPMFLIFTFDF